jgi:hypothetical protein
LPLSAFVARPLFMGDDDRNGSMATSGADMILAVMCSRQ